MVMPVNEAPLHRSTADGPSLTNDVCHDKFSSARKSCNQTLDAHPQRGGPQQPRNYVHLMVDEGSAWSHLCIPYRNIFRPKLHPDRHVVRITELALRELQQNCALAHGCRSRSKDGGRHQAMEVACQRNICCWPLRIVHGKLPGPYQCTSASRWSASSSHLFQKVRGSGSAIWRTAQGDKSHASRHEKQSRHGKYEGQPLRPRRTPSREPSRWYLLRGTSEYVDHQPSRTPRAYEGRSLCWNMPARVSTRDNVPLQFVKSACRPRW